MSLVQDFPKLRKYRFMKKNICVLILLMIGFFVQADDSLRIHRLFNITRLSYADSVPTVKEVTTLKKEIHQKYLPQFYYSLGVNLFYQKKIDSARAVSKLGLTTSHKIKNSAPYQIKILNLTASTYLLQQDYPNGIKYYEKALTVANKTNDFLQVGYINLNMANLFFSLQEYSSAYTHSKIAYEELKKHPSDPFYSKSLAILAVSEVKVNKFSLGLKHAQKALEIASQSNDIISLLIAYHAQGAIYFEKDNYSKAIEALNKSSDLSQKVGSKDFIMLNEVGLLKAYQKAEEYNKAIQHGEKALQLAQDSADKTKSYSIYKFLGECYFALGQHSKAYTFSQKAHALFLEKNSIESQRAVQEIKAKYETERKDKLIAQNSLELTREKLKSIRFKNTIYFLVVGILLISLFFFAWRFYQKRKIHQLQIQKEREKLDYFVQGEERERERMASELHDGVSSDLTAIKYRLEGKTHIEEETKDAILKTLVETQNNVRRIAHNLTPINIEKLGLVGAIKHFVSEFEESNVLIKFYHQTADYFFTKNEKLLLFRATQELVQNALKHANPKIIEVQLLLDKNKKNIRLIVENDGKGFDIKKVEKKFGIQNLEQKINAVQGSFKIDSSTHQYGTIAIVEIPQQKSEK